MDAALLRQSATSVPGVNIMVPRSGVVMLGEEHCNPFAVWDNRVVN